MVQSKASRAGTPRSSRATWPKSPERRLDLNDDVDGAFTGYGRVFDVNASLITEQYTYLGNEGFCKLRNWVIVLSRYLSFINFSSLFRLQTTDRRTDRQTHTKHENVGRLARRTGQRNARQQRQRPRNVSCSLATKSKRKTN